MSDHFVDRRNPESMEHAIGRIEQKLDDAKDALDKFNAETVVRLREYESRCVVCKDELSQRVEKVETAIESFQKIIDRTETPVKAFLWVLGTFMVVVIGSVANWLVKKFGAHWN